MQPASLHFVAGTRPEHPAAPSARRPAPLHAVRPTTGSPTRPRPAQPAPAKQPASTLSRLMAEQRTASTIVQLPRREVVYGCFGLPDNDRSVYFVERGFVKVVATSRDGKECLLGIFTAGDIVGELCLGDECRSESVVTMTPAVLRRMSSSRLMSSLDKEDVREEFIRYMANRMLEQQRLITDLVTADSEYRLAAILMHLAHKIGHQRGELLLINARITQEELSAMVGTTRSRIGLFLRRFVESGAVLRGRRGMLAVHEERMEEFMNAS